VTHRAHHLPDDRLFDSYITERAGNAIDPPAAEHLADCEACSRRYAELVAFMSALRRDGDADADAVFTPERLRLQQQQIARRIEQVGRPAHVISFPTPTALKATGAASSRTAPRWVAGAAAAGLFVGAVLGASYEWNVRGSGPTSYAAHDVNARVAPVATRGSSPADVANDDAFLSDLELALERPHTRELQAFDALTPHVREVRDQR
jgi:anti-sigma factor RsiW